MVDVGPPFGGCIGQPQHPERIGGGVGVVVDRQQPAVDHETAGQVLGLAVAISGRRLLDSEPGSFAHPTDGPGRRSNRSHQLVGVVVAQPVGDFVLVIEHQSVTASAGDPVELDSRSEQDRRRLTEHLDVGGIDCGTGGPSPLERLHVAQATVPQLDVGPEGEGDLAVLVMQAPHPLGQAERVGDGIGAPLLGGGLRETATELFITDQVADVEERGGGIEIVARQLQQAFGNIDSLAELEALVPDRIPDTLDDVRRVDVGSVHEHQVEVALGGHGTTSVAADRGQCHPVFAVEITGEVPDPGVEPIGVGPGELVAEQ